MEWHAMATSCQLEYSQEGLGDPLGGTRKRRMYRLCVPPTKRHSAISELGAELELLLLLLLLPY